LAAEKKRRNEKTLITDYEGQNDIRTLNDVYFPG
jgi:hypothetical protein